MNTNKIFASCVNFFRRWRVRNNRITLIEKLNTGGTGSLYEIKRECERRGLPFTYNIITQGDYAVTPRNIPGLVRLFTVKAFRLATSSHVFLNDNFLPLAYMRLSEETKVIQLWHGMGSFKKFGGSSETDPALLSALRAASAHTTHILASSAHIRANYAEAFLVPERKVLCIGCPQADYYFRAHDVAAWREAFYEEHPDARGKKLVLYAPTFRGDAERDRRLLDAFDFAAFHRELGEEYYLMVRLHPQIQSARVPETVADMTDYPNVRKLLLMTDLLIADYSSIAVEYALLNRPIVLYAFDRDWYLREDRGFYYDFEKTAPGPIVETMPELLACLKEEAWDLEKVSAFAHLHNDFFDDQSAARIVDYYFFGGERRVDSAHEPAPFYEEWEQVGRGRRWKSKGDGKLPDKWASHAAQDAVRDWESERRERRKKERARKKAQELFERNQKRETAQGDKAAQKDRASARKNDGGKDRKEDSMKVIAGLGNPTDEYKGTRHNVGFMAIDRIAEANHIAINQHKFKAMVGSGFIGGQKVLLVKPLTYMNLSGESLRPVMDFYKLDPEDILVIYDDISLEPGMLRIRKKGSAGGHNGMKSIIKHLGSDTFPRIRVGIGGEKHPGQDLADYVLGHFREEEKEPLGDALDKAARAAELFAAGELDEAMNRYSIGKKRRKEQE